MIIRLLLVLCACACATAMPAAAKPWNVMDLGKLQKDEHCMLAAARTFKSLRAEYGAERLRASDWVTYADRIAGQHDALISCNYAGFSSARATLVVHSAARHVDAHFIARRISLIFEGHAKQVTQDWRDSLD